MRFSTVAAAAAFLGMVVATPHDNIVYETEIITITSCAPEKPNCPYATHTSTVLPEVPPAEETSCTEEYDLPEETGVPEHEEHPDHPEHPEHPPVGHNQTVPHPEAPPAPVPEVTPVYVPSGNPTGGPAPPQNTTTPQVPAPSLPAFDNSASKMGASFIAIVGVAAFAILA